MDTFTTVKLALRRSFEFSLLLVLSTTIYGQQAGPEVRVDNTAKYAAAGRYDWTVFIEAEDWILNNVDRVEYTLHPTFSNPVRSIDKRGTGCAFALSSNAWGEFTIGVKVSFKDGRVTKLDYHLDLFQKSKTKDDKCSQHTKKVIKSRTRRGR